MPSTQSTSSNTKLAYGFLTLTALCWAANAIFAKMAVGEVSPMLLIAARWLGVVAIVFTLAGSQIREYWATIRPHLGYIAAMGALGYTTFNALFYGAAHTTSAINLGILQSMTPVFVMLAAYAVYRTPVSGLQMIGVAITLSGVAMVAAQGDWHRLAALSFNPGDIMVILACLIYAGYTVWLRKRPDVPALVWFGMLAFAAFAAAVPGALIEWQLGHLQWPTTTGWILAGLTVVFPSLLAQLCFMRGVELIGPGRSGVFVNLVPVLASIAAVLVLGEVFYWYHGTALVLVLGGIWVAERWAPAEGPAPVMGGQD